MLFIFPRCFSIILIVYNIIADKTRKTPLENTASSVIVLKKDDVCLFIYIEFLHIFNKKFLFEREKTNN